MKNVNSGPCVYPSKTVQLGLGGQLTTFTTLSPKRIIIIQARVRLCHASEIRAGLVGDTSDFVSCRWVLLRNGEIVRGDVREDDAWWKGAPGALERGGFIRDVLAKAGKEVYGD